MALSGFKWEHASGASIKLEGPEVEGALIVFSSTHYDTDYYVFGPSELVDELQREWIDALRAFREFEDSEESQLADTEWPDEPDFLELARQINERQ